MSWNRLNKLRFVKAALGTFTWSKFHFLSVTKAQGVLAVHITGGGDSTYFLVWKFTLSKFFLDKRSVIYFLSTSSPPPRSKACKKAWSSMRLIPKRSTVPPFSVFFGAVLGGKLIFAYLHSKVDNKLRWKILGANVLNAVREWSMYNPPFFLCSSHWADRQQLFWQ